MKNRKNFGKLGFSDGYLHTLKPSGAEYYKRLGAHGSEKLIFLCASFCDRSHHLW
jgi:hypothetical protein